MSKLYSHYLASYRQDTPQWREYLGVAGDLYNSPQLQKLGALEHHFKINRLQHIGSVAYLSFLIARRLGLDYVTAARAATMHDLVYYDWREDDISHKLHGYRHPGFALKNAYYLCGTLSKKEINIIKRHMWPLTPIPPKYAESWVVTAADKYCAAIEMYYSSSKSFRKKFCKETGLPYE